MASRPAIIQWLLDSDPAIRWQVMRDLTGAPATPSRPSGPASPPKAGAPNSSRPTRTATGPTDQEDGWMTTNDTLTLLKDLGADPAERSAGPSTGCASGRLVSARQPAFLPRRNGALHQRQNPRRRRVFQRRTRRLLERLLASSSKMAAGTARHRPARALPSIRPSACSKDSSNTNGQGANGGRHQGPDTGGRLSARAPHVPLAAPAKSSTSAGSASRFPSLALRRLARARLSAERRHQARRRVAEAMDMWRSAATRTGAGRSTSFIPNIGGSIGDGDRGRQGKPLEHTARAASPRWYTG